MNYKLEHRQYIRNVCLFAAALIHRLLLFLRYFACMDCSCNSPNDINLATTNNSVLVRINHQFN
jgi:hypothetical protein